MKTQAKTFIGNYYILYTLGLIFVFCLWFLLSYTVGNNNLYFPSPIETFKRLFEFMGESYIYRSIGWTLLRTLIGFGASFIAAILLGTVAGNYHRVYLFLKPLMLVFKSLPTAAFVFLFLVLSGSRFAPIYIVFLISFPILYEAIAGGMLNITQEVKDSLRLDSANYFTTVFKVKLPLALPYLIVGLTSSFALSLRTEIMAEIITGDTNAGIGNMISAYRMIDATDLTPVFSLSLVVLIFVLIIDLIGMIINKHIDLEK